MIPLTFLDAVKQASTKASPPAAAAAASITCIRWGDIEGSRSLDATRPPVEASALGKFTQTPASFDLGWN